MSQPTIRRGSHIGNIPPQKVYLESCELERLLGKHIVEHYRSYCAESFQDCAKCVNLQE